MSVYFDVILVVVVNAVAVGGVEDVRILVSLAIIMISFANSSGREGEKDCSWAVGFAGGVLAFRSAVLGAPLTGANLGSSGGRSLVVVDVGVVVFGIVAVVGVVVEVVAFVLFLSMLCVGG